MPTVRSKTWHSTSNCLVPLGSRSAYSLRCIPIRSSCKSPVNRFEPAAAALNGAATPSIPVGSRSTNNFAKKKSRRRKKLTISRAKRTKRLRRIVLASEPQVLEVYRRWAALGPQGTRTRSSASRGESSVRNTIARFRARISSDLSGWHRANVRACQKRFGGCPQAK